MIKKVLVSSIVIFVVWTVLDFLFHGYILKEAYTETADLWRPLEEAKMILNSIVVFIVAVAFTLIYVLLVDRTTMGNAIIYGLLIGIAGGISMGYGMYAWMPIPYFMAAIWFIAHLVNGLAGGIILGLLAK